MDTDAGTRGALALPREANCKSRRSAGSDRITTPSEGSAECEGFIRSLAVPLRERGVPPLLSSQTPATKVLE
jgi:hypothetical protein